MGNLLNISGALGPDALNRFSIPDIHTLVATDLSRNDPDTYKYMDLAVDLFTGDYEIKFDNEITSVTINGTCIPLTLTNNLGDWLSTQWGNSDNITVAIVPPSDLLLIRQNPAGPIDTSTSDYQTKAYYTFTRSFTSNNVVLQVYSDSNRTVLIDTLILSGLPDSAYRYMYLGAAEFTGGSGKLSSVTANWESDLFPAPPAVNAAYYQRRSRANAGGGF